MERALKAVDIQPTLAESGTAVCAFINDAAENAARISEEHQIEVQPTDRHDLLLFELF